MWTTTYMYKELCLLEVVVLIVWNRHVKIFFQACYLKHTPYISFNRFMYFKQTWKSWSSEVCLSLNEAKDRALMMNIQCLIEMYATKKIVYVLHYMFQYSDDETRVISFDGGIRERYCKTALWPISLFILCATFRLWRHKQPQRSSNSCPGKS